jgi:mycothiol synthase
MIRYYSTDSATQMKEQTLDTNQTTESISMTNAPAIPGLSFRHFRGDEDYPALLEVNNTSKIADGLEHDLHTLETLKHVYGNTPNHDPRKDMLIAQVDGRVVAYNRVYWEHMLEGYRNYAHFGFVLPEWRHKGLGSAMIRWAEDRARQIEAGQPNAEQGEVPAYVSTEVHANALGLENLLKSEGYQAVRYGFHMETPDLDHIPDAPMPEGLEVRPAKPEHYRAIWEAEIEAFRDHWGVAQPEDADYDRWINDPIQQPELWVVAWDIQSNQVAGSILNFINHEYNARTGRNLGYTEFISVRRPWRRRGLARALLARSMKLHRDFGMTQTALGVDTQNPSGALRLYESMGYKVVSQETYYRKSL